MPPRFEELQQLHPRRAVVPGAVGLDDVEQGRGCRLTLPGGIQCSREFVPCGMVGRIRRNPALQADQPRDSLATFLRQSKRAPGAGDLGMLGDLGRHLIQGGMGLFGLIERDGKKLYRYRASDYRIYFEPCAGGVTVHRILHKNTISDFLFRSKLPMVAEDEKLGETQAFWTLIDEGVKAKAA